MKKLFVLAIFGLTLVFASNGFAAGYGAAGCGFGGHLIKENKILHQIGAWFLNGLLGNQTFAMTSGTSGCSSMAAVTAGNEQKIFVESNYETLAKEMAVGEGENLTTLAALLGCSGEQAGAFGNYTQEHYDTLFQTAETTPAQMLDVLKVGLSATPAFAASCQKI